MILQHKFVEYIPAEVENGVLYISMQFGTTIHKCVCGCGNEVVTPFSPTDWKLTFDGKTVTLHPSIGNWNFECQSHYWIRKNVIEHAGSWSGKQIQIGREADAQSKADFYTPEVEEQNSLVTTTTKISMWKRILKFIGI